jgi:hypothetical protein
MGINKRAGTGRELRKRRPSSLPPQLSSKTHPPAPPPLTCIYSASAFPFLCGTVKRHESIQEAAAGVPVDPQKVQIERFQWRESAVEQRQRQFPGPSSSSSRSPHVIAGGSTFGES